MSSSEVLVCVFKCHDISLKQNWASYQKTGNRKVIFQGASVHFRAFHMWGENVSGRQSVDCNHCVLIAHSMCQPRPCFACGVHRPGIAVIDKHASERGVLWGGRVFAFNGPAMELFLISFCSLSHYNLPSHFPLPSFSALGAFSLYNWNHSLHCLQLSAFYLRQPLGWQSFPPISETNRKSDRIVKCGWAESVENYTLLLECPEYLVLI